MAEGNDASFALSLDEVVSMARTSLDYTSGKKLLAEHTASAQKWRIRGKMKDRAFKLSLDILTSESSVRQLATGTAAGVIGMSVFCIKKAAAGVQLLSVAGAGIVVAGALAIGLGIGIGIGISIFHSTKDKENKVAKMH